MTTLIKATFNIALAGAVICIASCKKFLDERPDKNLVVPQSLQDLQSLLDYQAVMNNAGATIGEASADNYYLTSADWSSLTSEANKNVYIWSDDIFLDNFPNDWSRTYQVVYYTNVVLQHITNMPRNEKNRLEWDNVKGSALFFRARSFHNLAVNFANAYDSATASYTPGIPLRLDPDFNETSIRSSIGDSYRQILSDLHEATSLLPVNPLHVLRPSRPAAYGMLSRVYLSMGNYQLAAAYADSCLAINNSLLNYNTLNSNAAFPFTLFNAEVLNHMHVSLPQHLNNSRAKIDSTLYNSYNTNDLRKTLFFKNNGNGSYGFKGSYAGSINLFVGVAKAEIFLNRAEAKARIGKIQEAMLDLNTLMMSRWKAGTFVPYTANSSNEALLIILRERRKELVMQDLRWMDIKRLNKEPFFKTTIRRLVNNQFFELPSGDARYALPIPSYVINLTGMTQNPR